MTKHLSSFEDLGKALRYEFYPSPRVELWKAVARRVIIVSMTSFYAWAAVPPGYAAWTAGAIVIGFASKMFW